MGKGGGVEENSDATLYFPVQRVQLGSRSLNFVNIFVQSLKATSPYCPLSFGNAGSFEFGREVL